MREINKKTLLFVILSGFIFILLFSVVGSPLYPNSYKGDATFFSMMGRAIISGRVPYRDYVDVKGPVFFFWQALGQLLVQGRIGIFILECISMIFSSIFLYLLCTLFDFGRKKIFVVFSFVYFIFITTIWGGNTLEEYALPLNLLCLYIGLLYLKHEWFHPIMPLIYGLVFGCFLFSKITVSAPLVAIVLTIVVYMIKAKAWDRLRRCVLCFLIGLLFVAVPVLLYFYANHAIHEMLRWTVFMAFGRGVSMKDTISIDWEYNLFVCYAGAVMGAIELKRKKGKEWWEAALLISMAVMTGVALHFGTPYRYYYTTLIPTLILILLYEGRAFDEMVRGENVLRIQGILIEYVMILGVVFSSYVMFSVGTITENARIIIEKDTRIYNACREIYDYLPENERTHVYAIDSGMNYYEVNHILPEQRYLDGISNFCVLYPPALEEIIRDIDSSDQKWIISQGMDQVENVELKQNVMKNYHLEKVFDHLELWKKNS